ncbi:MAG TPA: response regulator, partial [Acidobacteriota bacterium]|nr:response regulator [Acidobacteriota bacterium]
MARKRDFRPKASHLTAMASGVLTASRQERAGSSSEERHTGERSCPGGETILVVDDVDGVRELICEVLEMQGYEVLLARDGRQALEVAEQHKKPIDLLLTDVVMPQMGGQELANTLSSRWPETKIIFMSGYSDEAISRQGVLKAGTAFIKKPFTADSLTRRIRTELDA